MQPNFAKADIMKAYVRAGDCSENISAVNTRRPIQNPGKVFSRRHFSSSDSFSMACGSHEPDKIVAGGNRRRGWLALFCLSCINSSSPCLPWSCAGLLLDYFVSKITVRAARPDGGRAEAGDRGRRSWGGGAEGSAIQGGSGGGRRGAAAGKTGSFVGQNLYSA